MRDQKRKIAGRSSQPVDLFAVVQAWSRTVLQLSAIAFVIALGYILYGVFSGALSSMPAEQMQRVASNLALMGQLLALAGFVATLAVVILTLEEIAFTVVMGMAGAALMFGMPLVVASNLADQASRPAAVINEWTRNAGMAMLFVVGIRIVWEIAIQLKDGGSRSRAERAEAAEATLDEKKKWKKPGMWDRCWNMPYCHDAVKEICPAFKAGKSCWRFGYGCNCDPSLIETLIRTGGASAGKASVRASSERRTREAAYVRSDLEADTPVGIQRTIPCTKCPIFIEHQRQKFKLLNPVAVTATILAMIVLYQPLTSLYSGVIDLMAQTAARLTYGDMVDPGEWIGYLNTSTVQVFFFLFVGMIALAYVLKAVEWAVLKRMCV